MLIEKNIDIYRYPSVFTSSKGSVTIGDLHGNSIKFANFLFRHNVIQFKHDIVDPMAAFHQFVQIYEYCSDLSIKRRVQHEQLTIMIKEFNQFIAKLTVNDQATRVRLIGDELSDRGSNDYFTLKMLSFLHEHHVDVHITISNHSIEFIIAFERLITEGAFIPRGDIIDAQKTSLNGLIVLLKTGVIDQDEVIDIVNQSYKPMLKILDYTLSKDGVTLFTHAPVRFDLIQCIAKRFDVIYNDATKEALAATIDDINTKFAVYVKSNKVHELLDVDDIIDVAHMTWSEVENMPLVNMVWNRWDNAQDTIEARPARINGYTIRYVHGHDIYKSDLKHVINLDTLSGKAPQLIQQQAIAQAERILANPNSEPWLVHEAQYELECFRERVLDLEEK